MKAKLKLLTLAFLALTFCTQAETIYVDVNNTSGIEDGSGQHPFNTIKEGIDAASPGDIVFIKQGTYLPGETWGIHNNSLYLKPGVKIVGENPDFTIIDGYIVDTSLSNLSIGLEKLAFIEFHFNRNTSEGPFTSQNIVKQCKTSLIRIAHGDGIPLNDTTPGPNYGFIIENNKLGAEGNIEFIQGEGCAENRIRNNMFGILSIHSGGGYTYLIDNNDIEFGISDKSGANTTTISNNRIANGPVIDKSGGNQYGIEDQIIKNNIINCNEDSPLLEDEYFKAGIYSASASATIRNNTIICTGNVSGIRASSGPPFHVVDNTIVIDEVPDPGPNPDEGTVGLYNCSGWGRITGNKIMGGGVGYYSKAGTIEFANNEIENSFTGFYSKGAEIVHHNIIENCFGNGMILDGLRGPIFNNNISNNAGSGILVLHSDIDLGGGEDGSPGCNQITGNGNFDLYIAMTSIQSPVLYAKYNVWDHTLIGEIMRYDIRDASDSTGLLEVDISPMGHLAVDDKMTIGFRLYPNPGSGTVRLRYQIKDTRHLISDLYSISGMKIRGLVNEIQKPGEYELIVDVNDIPAGVYFVRFISGGQVVTKKIVIR